MDSNGRLSISNSANYNKVFQSYSVEPYMSKYIELINEYMLYVIENMIVQDETYLLFLIRRGIETVMHCFKILLMYTKNLELTIFHCKKALYYYIEFIGQISDIALHHSYLQLNSKDATLFVYKKTIYDISNTHRKNFSLRQPEQDLLAGLSSTISLFNELLIYALMKERLRFEKKETIIHFSMEHTKSIVEKLFSKQEKEIAEKSDLCLYVFQILQIYDIDTVKYISICENFVRKLGKRSDVDYQKLQSKLQEKVYSPACEESIKSLTPLRFVNWVLSP